MSAKRRKIVPGHLLLISAFSVIALLPMIFFGVASSNDFAQNFQRAAIIHDSVASGSLSPPFGAQTNGGLGDLAVRFYPPMVYYVLSASTFLAGEWYFGTLITYLLLFFASGLGVYLWALEAFSAKTAIIAAGIFTFAPYHLNVIYNNGLIAEFAALAVIPFCFLFAARTISMRSVASIIGLSVSYALLILTHLPSTIIVSICLAIYSGMLIARQRLFAPLARLAIAVAFSAAASSFYWVRMAPEIAWVKHSGPEYFSGIYDYRRNFVFAPQNFFGLGDDQLNLWLADLMLLAIILVTVPSFYLFFKKHKKLSTPQIVLTVLFVFSIFMATPPSGLVWEYLPFLQRIQFPWRWLGIISVVGSLLGSYGLANFSSDQKHRIPVLATILFTIFLAFFAFTSAFLVKGSHYIPREEFNSQISDLAAADSYIGWLPIWASDIPEKVSERVRTSGRSVDIIEWTAANRSFLIGNGNRGEAEIGTYFYPRWQASVNRNDVPVKYNSAGLIVIDIPEGPARVNLTFREPAYITFAQILSVAIWFALLTTIMVFLIKSLTERTRKTN